LSEPALSPETAEAYDRLRSIVRKAGGMVVGYSGGVDSSLLLKVASMELGARAVGVIGVSPSLAPGELAEARETARAMGARYREVEAHELSIEDYARNPVNRCYWCKGEILKHLFAVAGEEGLPVVADGYNAEDSGDHRPGQQAARERGVASPLAEAGFTKARIRELARALGVPSWDKPARPCLSSRIAYGVRITRELLERVGEAERMVRAAVPGAREVRVRHLADGSARVEVEPAAVEQAVAARDRIVRELSGLGYAGVSVDPKGYRRGAMLEGS
jgi:uncharacterized protein